MADKEKITFTQTDADKAPISDAQSNFIFIDGFAGVVESNGVVRFRLFRTRLAEDDSAVRETAAYLAMSYGTLVSVHRTLGKLIGDMQEAGRFKITEEPTDGG